MKVAWRGTPTWRKREPASGSRPRGRTFVRLPALLESSFEFGLQFRNLLPQEVTFAGPRCTFGGQFFFSSLDGPLPNLQLAMPLIDLSLGPGEEFLLLLQFEEDLPKRRIFVGELTSELFEGTPCLFPSLLPASAMTFDTTSRGLWVGGFAKELLSYFLQSDGLFGQGLLTQAERFHTPDVFVACLTPGIAGRDAFFNGTPQPADFALTPLTPSAEQSVERLFPSLERIDSATPFQFPACRFGSDLDLLALPLSLVNLQTLPLTLQLFPLRSKFLSLCLHVTTTSFQLLFLDPEGTAKSFHVQDREPLFVLPILLCPCQPFPQFSEMPALIGQVGPLFRDQALAALVILRQGWAMGERHLGKQFMKRVARTARTTCVEDRRSAAIGLEGWFAPNGEPTPGRGDSLLQTTRFDTQILQSLGPCIPLEFQSAFGFPKGGFPFSKILRVASKRFDLLLYSQLGLPSRFEPLLSLGTKRFPLPLPLVDLLLPICSLVLQDPPLAFDFPLLGRGLLLCLAPLSANAVYKPNPEFS